MITFFRNISESWFVKALLALITVSMMGLFGLGSMTSMWGKEQTAIRVGNATVKGQELLRSVDTETKKIAAMTGNRTYISIGDAVKMGVLDKVIQNDINSLLYQQIADDMGLIASDAAVGNYIVNNQNFQTITGSFDRALLMAYLQQMQMSEQMFTSALQEELSRKHLTDAIEAVIAVPEVLSDKMYGYVNEARDIDVILVPSTAVKVNSTPDKDTLQAYYESMEDQLYAPEYRTVSVLKLTPDKVAADIQVDDAVLKQMYEEKQALYSKPERRRVEQILVDSEEKANELFALLTDKNFAQIAKDKAGQETVDLGWLEKNGVVEEVGDAVFNAPVNQVLKPVQSMFGYHILIVRDVQAAEKTPFAAVKDDLKKAVQAEKAYDILYAKSKQLDEALGEGLALSDAAARIGMTTEKAVSIDAGGMDKSGKSASLPTDLVQEVFLSKAGDATSLLDYQNGFIVAEVQEIEPVYLKPFDAVQKELKAEWLKDEQKKQAPAFADTVLNAAQKDKALKTVALFYHLDEKTLDGVKRADVTDLPADVVVRLFNAKQGDIELIPLADGDYVVAQIKKITPADATDSVSKATLNLALQRQMVASVVDEMMAFYADKEKVQVNQAVIEETFAPYMKGDNADK